LAEVTLAGLTRRYSGVAVVSDVNLQIASGEFFSLLGPSGCGKTTTLRMIAGFVDPTAGQIYIDDDEITHRAPEKRDIGIVFQNYAIFPHMSVHENIAFGLRMRRIEKPEIGRRVGEALRQVGLVGYEARYQPQLSGGEQQRVALARVLVTQPRILLLDEPLSALDKNLREEMKYWIKDLQKNLGITTIYVTHDQSEALTMSDRIGIMNRGKVVQVGGPADVYEHPADLFVTTFIGESNLLDATIAAASDTKVDLMLAPGIEVPAPARPGIGRGQRARLVIRPENVLLDDPGDGEFVRLTATLDAEIYQGALIRYRLTLAGQSLIAEIQNRADRQHRQTGSNVTVYWHPQRTEVLPAQ
jgi:putative spermidine/putrescine transport system ATP-binding protein